jgi:hypothetical protein
MKYPIIILICLGAVNCFAQMFKSGSIEGTVIDKDTQQPLAGANIFILGTRLGTASDPSGLFIIDNVPVGVYQIKVVYIGYEQQIKTEIRVLTNRVSMVNFILNPAVLESDETIQVKSNYFSKDYEKPVSSKSLSPREIKSSAGSAEDIFRIIQAMPGVSSTGSKDANLIVRGGALDENRTLLDNVEIYNPLHFARPGASMGVISIVNPDLLQSVDFITGGFPVKYGDKQSSVFDMKLKEGNRTNFNTDMNANVGGFSVLLDGPIHDNGNMVFSIRRGFFDLLTNMMGKPVIPRYWDIVGKISYQPGNVHKISLLGFYYLDDFKKEGISIGGGHGSDIVGKYYYIKRDDFGSAFGLNWKFLYSKHGYMLTTAAYTSNGWRSNLGSEIDHDQSGEEIVEKEFHFKSEISYKILRDIELKGGVFYKTINSDHYIWKEQDTTRTGYIFSADTVQYNPSLTFKLGSFMQTILYPVPGLSFNLGIRYDYFDYIRESKVSPRVSFSYCITSSLIINGAYGYYYQTPAAYQVALDPANIELHSSRAVHHILGIEYLFNSGTKISIEGYHKDLDNTFTSYDTSYVISNYGSGFSRGIEFYLQKKMTDKLMGSVAYTYSVSKRKDYKSSPEYYFNFDQKHSFTFIYGYKISENWQIGAKFQYNTGMPYTQIVTTIRRGQNWYIVEGEKNSSRYPDYHKLDIRIDRSFHFNSWSLTAYIDIWNAYNRKNVIYYRFEADENGNIHCEETYDFPILPILGISAQF